MNLQIMCVEAEEFETTTTTTNAAPTPAPPARVDVHIGRSRGNRACVNAPGPVSCALDAGDMGNRINPDHSRARDSFEVRVEGNKVCARRTDRAQGWSMNLKISCVEAAEFPPARTQINIGKSGDNKRCVDAPSP